MISISQTKLRGLGPRANYADRATAPYRLGWCQRLLIGGGGGQVVGATDRCCRDLGFLDRSRYFFFQVAPQLCSQDWVDPVPDSLLLGGSGGAGESGPGLWVCGLGLWPLDHRGGQHFSNTSSYYIQVS
jgi:hypothetical protein